MLVQDVRFSLRMLAKDPVFALVAILTLALGIGATSTIFGIVDTLLFRPLPHIPAPDRIVWIFEHTKEQDADQDAISAANFLDYRAQAKNLTHISALGRAEHTLTGSGEPEYVSGFAVSANFFELLGTSAALGRTFEAGEDAPGKDGAVVLSDAYWRRRFAADPKIIGRTLVLDHQPRTVVGVMPQSFLFPKASDLWTLKTITPEMVADRSSRHFGAIARVPEGASMEEAGAEIEAIALRLGEQYPETNKGWHATLVPTLDLMVGPALIPSIALGIAVLFVLLIASANVSNLLLSRAASRVKEMAVRSALGAAPRRILAQMLTESVVLALLGGAGGVLVALWGIDAFISLIPAQMARQLPRLMNITLDPRMLGATFLVSLCTALIVGWLPARRAARVDLAQAFKDGGSGATRSAGQKRLREALVVGEVSLALMLLVGAGWAVQSVLASQHIQLGFDAGRVLTVRLPLPSEVKDEEGRRRVEELLRQVRAVPGVERAAASSSLPMQRGVEQEAFSIDGRPPAKLEDRLFAACYAVSADYLQTLGIPLLKGRALEDGDREDTPPVVVVSARFAATYFPDQDPLTGILLMENKRWQIVGVAGEVYHQNTPEGVIYLPYRQSWLPGQLVLRAGGALDDLGRRVREQLRAVDREVPVAEAVPMATLVSDSLAGRRILRNLFLGLAVLALLLASIGIYGVVSYSVSQRTAEIGIRAALGAAPRHILRMVMRQGLRLAVIGMALGLVLSLAVSMAVSRALPEGVAGNPLVFLSGCAILFGVACLACYAPARRAMRIAPLQALKRE